MGQKTLAAQIADGTTKTEGNIVILGQLAAKLVTLEMGFEILPGSAGPAGEVDTSTRTRSRTRPVGYRVGKRETGQTLSVI